MEYDAKTKVLKISWMDLEHIAYFSGGEKAGDSIDDNLEFEMHIAGIDVPVKEVEKLEIDVKDRVVIGCQFCEGRRVAEVRIIGPDRKVEYACTTCYDAWKAQTPGPR